jgi:hypothetical protein
MKKLFSYLLISSMVVLSSCTNYDDQFDDLNTQINSLKSQIEGFNSLSSGLTSLQGTVASLQSAVASLPQSATPATDISGLEASVAALQAALSGAATSAEVAALTADLAATQAALNASIDANATATTTAVAGNTTDIAALATSLEALTATIAELQASLATVSTAAEVTALATSLAAAQADLTSLLASSSFYNGTLTIGTQAQLDFAVSLGDKVKFINGGLDIDQTTTMDATQLTAVMAKVLNVTGAVAYTSTATTTTKGAFTSMTGAGSLAIEQAGNISLPKLTTVTGDLSLTGSASTLTVSLPVLTKVTGSITNAALGSATTYSMPAMVAFDSDLTINIDNAGTVDLSAFTNATNVDGTVETSFDALTVNAATLTAPVYTAGAITANRLTSVSLPKWKYATGSSFDRAATVVLPSVDPGKATSSFSIAIQDVFDAATSVHIIAAANSHTGVLASEHVNVTSTSTKLETLILGGTYTTINVSGSDVTSITFDGTAHSVTVSGTDVETLNLPYTSAAKGVFAVTSNTKLTSVTADKINGLSSFSLTGNADLTDISFAALKAAGATGATVAISGNDLSVESVNDAQTAPVVAKKVVSADLNVLKTFLADAISDISATSGTQVMVSVDLADVARAYDSTGAERDPVAADAVVANYDYLAVADNSTGNVAKVEEMYISSLSGEATFKVASVQADGTYGTSEAVSLITHTGLEDYYDIKNWADAATTTAALSAAGVEIVSYGKGQKTATFEFADTTLTNVSAVVTFTDGGVETVSVTTGSASTTASIAKAVALALESGDGVVSQYYTVTNGTTTKKLTFSSNAKGSHRQTFNLGMTAQVLSGSVGATAISFATASKLVANSIESTAGAYVQFRSTNAGVTGARNITLIGNNTATLLAASGVNSTHAGDDETFTAAKTGTANTLNNATERAAVSINNVQYLAGA